MTIEDKLKSLILSKHKSLRDFCITINIPYSTMTSILKRGVDNASISNIIKICSYFGISVDELSKGNIVPISLVTSPSLISEYTEQEKKLIIEFRMLSPEAQSSVCDFIKFKLASESTKKKPEKDNLMVAESQLPYDGKKTDV
ncbi:helix-turn-helix domain-containing protein [Megasphaera sp. WILCCON 0056]|uniref:helix-turn-helix domain-containing protein n=1 Tax=Megasphaera sp. WILCCON 0056 TaxID=3345340 RepID=UPI003A80B575